MSNPLISAKKAELESRIVNIVTLNRANTLSAGTVYCGRNSSRNSDCFNPLDLGLGNPYSHKNTNNCVWRVNSLEECLFCYKQWLWKLIQNENSQDNLMDWERMYLYSYALPISIESEAKTSNVAKRVLRGISQCDRGQRKNLSMLHYQTKD